MSGPVPSVSVVVEALQRLASALEDMSEELPSQLTLVKSPDATTAQKDEVLAVVEKQLRWLADDVARARRSIAPKETGHDRTL